MAACAPPPRGRADQGPVTVEAQIAAGDIDRISAWLWDAGALGIEERLSARGAPSVIVTTTAERADAVAAALRRAGFAPALGVARGPASSLRPWAAVTRVGRVVVHPPWLEPELGPDDLDVLIDPGSAFGHGAHPTTRLALGALAQVMASDDPPPRSVLDVGCGTGVLAIAAARLGAPRVVAVDVDADALTTAAANIAANHVADRVDLSGRPLHSLAERFDLVLANLEGPVLDQQARAIVAHTQPGGRVVVTGILSQRCDRVLDRFGRPTVLAREDLDGWAVLTIAPR